MNKVFVMMLVLYAGLAFAQVNELIKDIERNEESLAKVVKQSTTTVTKANVKPDDVPRKRRLIGLHESYYRLWLSLALIFSSTVFLVVILRYVKNIDRETLVTVVGLILVIQGALYIVTASISSEALTAAIGLLAAVGGYVLRGVGEKMKVPEDKAGS